jgi:hypothetical protein
VAELLGISEWDWKSDRELREEIASRSCSAYDKLQAYLHDYQAWHEFDADVQAELQLGRLPRDQQDELIRLFAAMQKSRSALRKEVSH